MIQGFANEKMAVDAIVEGVRSLLTEENESG